MVCKCEESKKPLDERRWYVWVRKGNYSAFNGYRFTPSDFSEVACAVCGRFWRTKAKYVDLLPDVPHDERSQP